ncbi:hypothetical protein [Brevibacillus nitrificans]|uniref:hypothetical protein n=1 Tax=Brevibacillus nitrificans TaxID=651560 RepID=UPI00285D742C|nr:hypothetical protein [Brevibacillus nitrificans]MDR7317823.1 hypothetical protein [Brevibacillus nitrificans]
MNLLSIVEQTDVAYKRAFSYHAKRSWGYLFWNEENPGHYDANHAHVSIAVTDLQQAAEIADEIIPFFEEKKHSSPIVFVRCPKSAEASGSAGAARLPH